jgi:hypothetical protein
VTGFWIGLPESKHERKKEKKVTGGPRVKALEKKGGISKKRVWMDYPLT